MKKNFVSVAALAVLVLASGCGGSGGGGSGGGSAGGNGPGEKPRETKVSDIIRASETGATFVGECQVIRFRDKTLYSQSRFTFMPEKSRNAGLPYSEQIELYEGEKCKDADHVATTVASGDYGFNPDGTRALITYQKYLFIPQRDKFATYLTSSSYCGLTAWETGVGQELSTSGNCWEETKQAAYLLTSLDGNSAKKIQVYNCPDENASVPNADCMKIKANRAE